MPHVKKFLAFLLPALMFVASQAQARTWPNGSYDRDPGRDYHHVFGEFHGVANYADPDFAEGARMASPLYNPLYQSYDVIVVVNKSDIRGKNGELYERGQRIRVYVRQEAWNLLNARNTQNIAPDSQSGLLYYWKTSTARPGHATPAGHYRIQTFSSDHKSSAYNNSPMPFAVFFRNDGYATHGVDPHYYSHLGHVASAGCVRLETQRAQDLFHLIGQVGKGAVDNLKRDGSPTLGADGQVAKVTAYKTLYIIRQ